MGKSDTQFGKNRATRRASAQEWWVVAGGGPRRPAANPGGCAARSSAVQTGGMTTEQSTDSRPPSQQESEKSGLSAQVDALVGEWLTVPDAATELGLDVIGVRRLLTDRLLVGVRRGHPAVLSIPAILVKPEPLVSLPGTWTLLADSGFGPLEALRWLFTVEDGASPVELLRRGHKTEVRRRAQALAF